MYASFFGLKEQPFNIAPDPKYLYLSPSHREALAKLMYGLIEKKGFIVVTGEVGTGKTTLLHTLLEDIDSTVKTAFVFYPRLDLQNLLQYILDDFDCCPQGTTTTQHLIQLHEFLISQHKKGETTVLVIDEAQNLSPPLLEDIRMLSNLEYGGEKLLQIVLVGQPEFQKQLELPQFRQLRQRIGVLCQIQPLRYAETQAYIQHRLVVAEAMHADFFTRSALKTIHIHAAGIPRMINTVCDGALLAAYAEGKRRITSRVVRQVVRDLTLQTPRGWGYPKFFRKAVVVLTGLLLLGSVYFVFPSVQVPLQQWYQLVKVNVERFLYTGSWSNGLWKN